VCIANLPSELEYQIIAAVDLSECVLAGNTGDKELQPPAATVLAFKTRTGLSKF
jgi:hypothetical protein